ncbi:DUF805 domain-containing protein [Lactobacillaceae bacterium 24-114]
MWTAYKNYWINTFKYRARSTRADFWWVVLMNVIIYAVLGILMVIGIQSTNYSITFASNYPQISWITSQMSWWMAFVIWVTILYCIATILPNLSLAVRRFRDAGLTGWTVLAIWLLEIIFSSSNSAVMTAIETVLGILTFVGLCLPTGYINKKGWWSPNYSDDEAVPTLHH